MNIQERILLSAILKPDTEKKLNMTPQRGIYVSGLTNCPRALWFQINKPAEINGKSVEYYDVDRDCSSDYICEEGNKLEEVMENHIKICDKMHFLDKQVLVTDLKGKVRGRIDFAVYHPELGTGVLDCKGMSDRVFNKFKSNISLKEFKEAYYAQVVYYINVLKADFGAIVGVNRSSGEVWLKMINTEDTKSDFEYYRNKCNDIINSDISNFMNLPIDENSCHWCDYNYICNLLK